MTPQEQLEAAMREAWTIISVLTRLSIETGGEPWPRALDWLAEHDNFNSKQP